MKQKGMSLVETIVAGGIVAAIGLGVSKGVQWKDNMTKTSEFKQDAGQFTQKIFDVLKDAKACKNTLGAMNAATTTGITQIMDKDGNVMMDTGTKWGKGVQISSVEMKDDPGMQDGVVIDPGKTGTTNLIIKFMGVKKTAYEQRELMEKIKIRVQTDSAGKIESCYSAATGEDMVWKRNPTDPTMIYYNDGNAGVEISNPKTKMDVIGWIKAKTQGGKEILMGTESGEYQILQADPSPFEFWNSATGSLAEVEGGVITPDKYILIGSNMEACTPANNGSMVYDPSIKRVRICEGGSWRIKRVLKWCLPKEFNKDNDDEYMNFKQDPASRRPQYSNCEMAQVKPGKGDSWDPDKGRGKGPPTTSLVLSGGKTRIKFDDDSDPCDNDSKCEDWKEANQ